MKAALLATMLACVAACVGSALAGVPLLAWSSAVGGLALVAMALEHARPARWTPAEREHDGRGDD